MAKVLVVDDSAIDRFVAGKLLQEYAVWAVVFADDGRPVIAFMDDVTVNAARNEITLVNRKKKLASK